jgi:indolepyruvate ferredoxin oxidoreductase beta subunit
VLIENRIWEIIPLKTKNIFLAGVGGQGVLLASEILCLSLMETGRDVKKSEVHGMAQRGGSVTSHVRYGEKVFSPLIPKGDAHILLGFEALEALRWTGFLKEDGVLLVNRQEINPTTVTSGRMAYPENIYERISEKHPNTEVVDGLGLAKEAGDVRAVNSVLVGAASRHMDVPEEIWKRVITRRLPQKFVSLNLRAFELGRTS